MFGITAWFNCACGLTGEREALDVTIIFPPEPRDNQLPEETLRFLGARR